MIVLFMILTIVAIIFGSITSELWLDHLIIDDEIKKVIKEEDKTKDSEK